MAAWIPLYTTPRDAGCHCPVVGRPVGIVTDRDLVIRAVARRFTPDARVDSVMSTDLITLAPDADLRDALKVFEDHAIRRLPLVAG
jgi:CBS domain-containing protein